MGRACGRIPVQVSRLPLNLPHAATIAHRLRRLLERVGGESPDAPPHATALALWTLLGGYRERGENPHREEAELAVEQAASLGRRLVEELEARGWRDDRLGQTVRNLFECLERGEEGAELSLRAGEDPRSPLRP